LPYIDDFSFKDKKTGVQKWNSHQVWKVPFSIDASSACIIKEGKLTRLDVKDKIIQPKVKR